MPPHCGLKTSVDTSLAYDHLFFVFSDFVIRSSLLGGENIERGAHFGDQIPLSMGTIVAWFRKTFALLFAEGYRSPRRSEAHGSGQLSARRSAGVGRAQSDQDHGTRPIIGMGRGESVAKMDKGICGLFLTCKFAQAAA